MQGRKSLAALMFGLVLLPGAMPALAQGTTEIYKCLDASGRPLYTSDKRDTVGKKCELVSREVNVMPSTGRRAPGAFPRESAQDRTSAKERQREILQQELVAEEQALSKARQALAEQEAVRSGDERNYARVQERLQPYKDSVETHQKNIEALKRELANLNR
jgi:hypothetical protein